MSPFCVTLLLPTVSPTLIGTLGIAGTPGRGSFAGVVQEMKVSPATTHANLTVLPCWTFSDCCGKVTAPSAKYV